MTELKITRVVTDLDINTSNTTYNLNGCAVWVGHKIGQAGIDDSSNPFYRQLYELCDAISRDTPGIVVNMSDPIIVKFLKATECI